MPNKVWHGIEYLFANFNGCVVMYKWFHATFHNEFDYFFMLGFRLNHVSSSSMAQVMGQTRPAPMDMRLYCCIGITSKSNSPNEYGFIVCVGPLETRYRQIVIIDFHSTSDILYRNQSVEYRHFWFCRDLPYFLGVYGSNQPTHNI